MKLATKTYFLIITFTCIGVAALIIASGFVNPPTQLTSADVNRYLAPDAHNISTQRYIAEDDTITCLERGIYVPCT
jgi:hypothetical protein